MQTGRHDVVHQVVFAGDGMENFADFLGFFPFCHGFKTKMGLLFLRHASLAYSLRLKPAALSLPKYSNHKAS